MRVVVKFHESAHADYEAWKARLSKEPSGNPGIARLHAEELIAQFETHGGRPPGAVLRHELDPPSWIWRFASDTTIRFVRREQRKGIWGGLFVEVLIIGVKHHRS